MTWHLILPPLLSLTVCSHKFLTHLAGGEGVEVFLTGSSVWKELIDVIINDRVSCWH